MAMLTLAVMLLSGFLASLLAGSVDELSSLFLSYVESRRVIVLVLVSAMVTCCECMTFFCPLCLIIPCGGVLSY